MTPLKSPSRRRSEADISGRLCCDAGTEAFNGSYVKLLRISAFGQEGSLGKRESSRLTPLWSLMLESAVIATMGKLQHAQERIVFGYGAAASNTTHDDL
jgi:hypothetical protein